MTIWRGQFLAAAAVSLLLTGCDKPAGGPRAGGDTIKVGEFASLTGSEASFGQSSHQGTLLAVEELNAAGGVLGKKIEIVEADNRGDKQEGASVRLVSMPSWELFELQSTAYRESVFPASVKKRIAVEAGVAMGWSKYVGDAGEVICMTTFGLSAPYETLYEHFGFTVKNVLGRAKAMLGA